MEILEKGRLPAISILVSRKTVAVESGALLAVEAGAASTAFLAAFLLEVEEEVEELLDKVDC